MANAVERIQAAIDVADENGASGDAAFKWVSVIALALAAEIDALAAPVVAAEPEPEHVDTSEYGSEAI